MSAGQVILAAGLLALVCQPAGAELFRYRVNPPTVDVLLSGKLDSSESVSGATVRKTDTTTTREKFDIQTTEGWVYHPALLIFDAGLQPEFEQKRDKRDQSSSEALGTFLGFNLDASVLPYKPYTVDLHASQNRSEYKNTLARDESSESSTYRAKLRLKEEYWLPTTFTLETRDRTTESLYTTTDKTNLAKLESRHRTETSKTDMESEFQDRTRGYSGNEIESQQWALRARNRYQPNTASLLNSSFRHTNDRSLGIDSVRTSLDSGLAIQHREELRSDYRLSLENQSEQGANSSNGTAMASLQHRLYENLTTSLSGNASKSDSTGGDSVDYGAVLNLAYNRRIPWGKLTASVGHTERIRDWRQVLAVEKYTEPPHTPVTVGVPFELAQFDIIPGTIEVWNADKSILYPAGDYSVVPIGRSVQFQWTNLITPPDPAGILISYDYETDPSAKTRSLSDSFGIGVNLWSMLGLNYNWSRNQSKLLSGAPGRGDSQDRSSQTLAASLNLGWRTLRSISRASVTETEIAAEKWKGGRGAAMQESINLGQTFRIGSWSATTLEMTDMTVSGDSGAASRSPVQTQSARQIFTFQPMRHMSISMGANYNGIKYKIITKSGCYHTQSSGYDATMRWRVGPGSLAASAFSKEIQSCTEETGSIVLEAEYRWRYGLWQPSVRYTLAEDEMRPLDTALADSKRIRYVLHFELERRF